MNMTENLIMAKKVLTGMRLDPALLDAMQRFKAESGAPFSWQMDQALREWLARKGVTIAEPPKKRKKHA